MTTTPHLTHLETTGLIQLAQEVPELEYLFRHVLVQDAAYESLLLADRQRLHLLVGETLERLFAERLAEFAPMLGHHFMLAGQEEKALHYLVLAGDTAVTQHANLEAITHFRQAQQIATDGQTRAYLYQQIGRALEHTGQFQQAITTYQQMVAEAEESGNEAMQLAGLMSQLTLFATPNPMRDPALAETIAQPALALAQKLNDAAAEVQIWRNLCIHYNYIGQFAEGTACGQRSLTLARQHQLKRQLAYTLNDIAAHNHEVVGRLGEALNCFQEAIQIWRDLGNLPMLTDGLSGAASICIFLGDYETAVAFAQEAHQISLRIGNVWGQSYSQYRLGTIFWDNGRAAAAIAVMEESIRLSEQAGFVVPQSYTRADLGLIYVSLGDFVKGRALIEQAIAVAHRYMPMMEVFGQAWLVYVQICQGQLDEAEATIAQTQQELPSQGDFYFFDLPLRMVAVKLWLQRGDTVQAQAIMKTVLTNCERTKAGQYLADGLYLEAQVWLLQGDMVKGRESLLLAQKTAESLNNNRLLWQILHSLSQIEPDPQQAAAYQQQAQTIIHFIADHAPPHLRDSFLNLPDVKAVFAQT